MLHPDNSNAKVRAEETHVKRSTTLTEVQAEAHSPFTGHGSGEYGAGGQAPPANHNPGTTGAKKGGY
jgi:hypothetical protein